MQTKSILLVGEPMGLFIAKNEGALNQVTEYMFAVAGAEFNVAVGMARLGHTVSYLTKLGDDPFGERIEQVLNQNKIKSEYILYSKTNQTGFMLKSNVSEGDPEIFYFRKNSAASTLSKSDIEKLDFSHYSHIHLTGILPALNPTTRDMTFYLLQTAKKHNLTVSFDPNLRPQLWEDKQTMIQVINDLAALSYIVLPGEQEGEILTGEREPEKISDFYLSHGSKIVVTKTGKKGAYVATENERFSVPGYPVEKIVDTVGAGDGFAVGVISGLMEGKSLWDSVKRGNAIGAIQVTTIGDNDGLPTREQLEKFMNRSLIV